MMPPGERFRVRTLALSGFFTAVPAAMLVANETEVATITKTQEFWYEVSCFVGLVIFLTALSYGFRREN